MSRSTSAALRFANFTATVQKPPVDHGHAILDRALRLIQSGSHQKALDLLHSAGRSDGVLNACGVCLMRLGNFDAAVRVYRSYVLPSGCTWIKADVDPEHIVNFATALMLAGHPAGCLEILHELRDRPHPMAVVLRQTLRKWASGLSIWNRFNWSFGKIEPSNCPVAIDFLPGVLESLAPRVETPATRPLPAGVTQSNLTV